MRFYATSGCKLILSVVALSCTAAPAGATEKYWIAHEAQLIVVGRFHEQWTYPWFDGWHVTGILAVDEVLYGSTAPHRINYRLVCRWAMCRTSPTPRIAEFFGEKGIWFLRSLNAQTWGPPGYGGIDPGFRTVDQRLAFEDYIRRYKH
jgi:hypothetical protein